MRRTDHVDRVQPDCAETDPVTRHHDECPEQCSGHSSCTTAGFAPRGLVFVCIHDRMDYRPSSTTSKIASAPALVTRRNAALLAARTISVSPPISAPCTTTYRTRRARASSAAGDAEKRAQLVDDRTIVRRVAAPVAVDNRATVRRVQQIVGAQKPFRPCGADAD